MKARLFNKPEPELSMVNITEIIPWIAPGHNAVNKSVEALGFTTAVLLQKLTPTRAGYKFTVLDGRRRLNAALDAGIKRIPALIYPSGDASEYHAIAATANLARAYSPLGEANHIESLMQSGFTPDEIASNLGISASRIRQRIRLLDHPPELRDAVKRRRVKPTTAAAIKKLTPSEHAEAIKKLQATGRLTGADVREIRQATAAAQMSAVMRTFEPEEAPTPERLFEGSARRAFNAGLSSSDLTEILDALVEEDRNAN